MKELLHADLVETLTTLGGLAFMLAWVWSVHEIGRRRRR